MEVVIVCMGVPLKMRVAMRMAGTAIICWRMIVLAMFSMR